MSLASDTTRDLGPTERAALLRVAHRQVWPADVDPDVWLRLSVLGVVAHRKGAPAYLTALGCAVAVEIEKGDAA